MPGALLIYGSFPLQAGLAPAGTIKVTRTLLDAGWEVDLLGFRTDRARPDDPLFSALVAGARVHETSSPFRKPSAWAVGAALRGTRIVAERGCDVLISFADVPWAHVAALAVARRSRRPWVACFTDPWSSHPLARMSRLRRRVERALERRTVARADRLVFTNAGLRQWVIGPHAEGDGAGRKSAVIPYFFDPALYPAARPRSDGHLLIRHMGNTPPGRYTPAFLEAISRLKAGSPDLWARLRLEFYGTLRAAHREEAGRRGFDDHVRFLPGVPYRESLRLMREADVLLLLTLAPADLAGLGQATLFLKMVDYVGAGRPIFGLAGQGSPAWETLAESGGVCASDDPCVIREALLRFLAAPRAPGAEIRLGFSKERVAPRWTRLLDAVLAGGSASP